MRAAGPFLDLRGAGCTDLTSLQLVPVAPLARGWKERDSNRLGVAPARGGERPHQAPWAQSGFLTRGAAGHPQHTPDHALQVL